VAEDLFEEPKSLLRQGDVFQAFAFFRAERSDSGSLQAVGAARAQAAMLLNQSCDVDKPAFTRLIVVPVVPLSVLGSADQTNVRKNKMFARLHLPAYRDLLPESFASFLEPMTVEKAFLEQAPRIVSLTEKGRRSLYVQYVRFLTRWNLAEIVCPACNVAFSTADANPIVND
jgi:hypothetical protein